MIDPSSLLKIRKIYEEKSLNSGCNTDFSNSFNSFCFTIKNFDDDKKNLMIFLLNEYYKLNISDFYSSIKVLLGNMDKYLEDGCDVYFVPFSKIIKDKNIKSDEAIYYFLKTPSLFDDIFLNKKKFFDTDLSELNKLKNKESIYLVFFDDFIGTGETIKFLLQNMASLGFNKNKIIIASLVSQKSGLSSLGGLCKKIFSCKIRTKGISENYKITSIERKKFLKIMADIEDSIGIKDGNTLRFGRGGSEALFTSFTKTPNNTFPIFWYPHKNNEKPPFPRFFRK